jgi:hypothetical protein
VNYADQALDKLQAENEGMRARIDRLGAENLTAWGLLGRWLANPLDVALNQETAAFLAGVPAENPDIHRVTLEDRVTELERRLDEHVGPDYEEQESPGVLWPSDKELVERALRFPRAPLQATLVRIYGQWAATGDALTMNVPGIVRALDQEARQTTQDRVQTVARWFPETRTASAFLRLADEWRIGA